jgi:hypothetical protein
MPSADDQDAARRIANCIGGVPHRALATIAWLNEREANYDSVRELALARVGVAVVKGQWTADDDGVGSFDSVAARWLSANVGDAALPGADSFPALSNTWHLLRGRSRPLNVMTSMAIEARLDLGAAYRWPLPGELAYYEGAVQGMRFDGSASAVSLFVFAGAEVPIRQLRDSLDAAAWRDLKRKFRSDFVYLSPLALHVDDRSYFRPGVSSAYGTHFLTALEQASLVVDGDRLTFAAVNSAEGITKFDVPFVDPAGYDNVILSMQRPMLYVLEDETTGAILAAGTNLGRSSLNR